MVRNHLNDKDPNYSINEKWDKIAALFPDWERLPFYENCAGFVFNFTQKDIDAIAIDTKVKHAQQVLTQNGYTYPVYKEKRKVFIYPDHIDKMRGVKLLGFYPYIAIGDGSNDLQLMQQSTIPVMPNSGAPELKEIVVQKNGFCSMKMEHAASFEMLDFAYNLLINKYTLP